MNIIKINYIARQYHDVSGDLEAGELLSLRIVLDYAVKVLR